MEAFIFVYNYFWGVVSATSFFYWVENFIIMWYNQFDKFEFYSEQVKELHRCEASFLPKSENVNKTETFPC